MCFYSVKIKSLKLFGLALKTYEIAKHYKTVLFLILVSYKVWIGKKLLYKSGCIILQIVFHAFVSQHFFFLYFIFDSRSQQLKHNFKQNCTIYSQLYFCKNSPWLIKLFNVLFFWNYLHGWVIWKCRKYNNLALGLGTHLFVKVPWPGCHLLLPV